MTTMNLSLVEARMFEIRQSRAASDARPMPSLFAEFVQVLKGGITPVNDTRVVLGEHLSRDLGLR